MSELRVDSVKSKGGGAPNLPKGVTISGITTAVTLGATTVDVSNVNVSGVVTSGTLSGSLLSTGTPTLGLGVTINSSGVAISGVATAGIVSATTLYGDGTNITGVGASIAPLFYDPDISDRTVTVGTGIGITFNQQIKAGSGNINLRLVSIGGTIVEAFGVGSSVTISENRLSFDPASDLDQNTIYCVDVPGTAFTNNEGTAYVGTAYTFQSKFTFKKLFQWGQNQQGELGQNNTASYSSPIQIPGLTWSSVSNGWNSQLGTKTDGTLWSWGYNRYGSLGINDSGPGKMRSSPVQIPGTTWSQDVDKITMGSGGSGGGGAAAIKTDGTLWVWGVNSSGELGINTPNEDNRSSPVQVPGTTWKNVSAGNAHMLATRTDGTLWAMGYGAFGQLGINSRSRRSSPTQIPGTTWAMAYATIEDSSSAIKTDGTLWMWGDNEGGQLGQNNLTRYSSPVQVPGTTWSKLHYGSSRWSTAAIKTDGTLWGWGGNDHGSLGQNSVNNGYSSPVQIGSSTDWSSVSLSYKAGQGLKTDGTLWAWGRGMIGVLGQNNQTERSSPVQIPGTDWSVINSRMVGMSGLTSTEG